MKVSIPKEGKAKIKIQEHDTWSMDHTLALIITPMLKQLHDSKHGAPRVEDGDVPEHLRSTNAPATENEWDTDDLYFDRWDWVLDEMIWAFEQIIDEDNDSQFHSGGNNITFEETELGSRVIPDPTHVFDKNGYLEHNKRINNGTRLFGKYFRSLWD